MVPKQENSPLRVIVVGNGFGGISAAIECKLRGFEVVMIERYVNSNLYGDIIDFFANGGRIIQAWDGGAVGDELRSIGITKAEYLQINKYDGKVLYRDPWFRSPADEKLQFAGHRGGLHHVIEKYARRIGVEFKLGQAVVDYKETESKAGVVLKDGEEVWADVIIAADGPRSLAREKVLHLKEKAESSGLAVYRSFFQVTDAMRNNPLLADYTDPEKHTIKVWIGNRVTMLAYGWNEGKNVAWVLLHPDKKDIEESWSFPAKAEDVAPLLEDFSPECRAFLENTPPNKMIDYKLVYRDAIKTWRSEGGRIILIGDAAHCHLPSSAQGGSQAIEDAVTVAICLEKSNGNVPLATEVAQRIRFNRANVLHASGKKNNDEWNEIPWDLFESDPKLLANRRVPWVLDFDAVKTAYEHYDSIASDVLTGKKGTLEELSLPAGNEE